MRQSKHLSKGINLMVGTLFLLILSPIVINIGYKALQKGDIVFVLIIGIVLAITAIILFVMGIKTLLKHLFEEK
ncbi:DUF6095 family protein [Ochrovirga pacifica]|uniref:DUF6095 family protein n=1 Tax=Ochrovirga pacifica TaxID=1042376 RepID=UPI0002559D80|nr:DUF6095 family protein [Ochrovirga pacifica]